MIGVSAFMIDLLFAVGLGSLLIYVLLWLLSPKMRREIEVPKYVFLEQVQRVEEPESSPNKEQT